MADIRVAGQGQQDESPRVILREDYRVPDYLVDSVNLVFELAEHATIVRSTMRFRRNPQAGDQAAKPCPPLLLDGEQLELLEVRLDGEALDEGRYRLGENSLAIAELPANFELQIDCRIDPAANLALEGLYMSDGMYCTQCEAEGFRRITYYPDRPDVMSVFTTRIVADSSRFPVLLSNGNKTNAGQLDDSRHWVEWHDPFPKPSYLFALVAGDLAVLEDSYVTMSGRKVTLQIFAAGRDLPKCHHAMRSLVNAMRWDEQNYGREYDLDLYMIVAVDFFNMGAMENKGLNIFNTSCVLADPRTQTDAAFQRVEGVIAHEYFHNWSGNRVTCRDWFQLSLKEGFTVYRDACFSADMNSPTVKRIEDVSLLRSAQFAEDAGPMAHPVRPDSYMEISNFYTLTIYEKGAEVIRMMHTLLGADAFRRGCDLYFDRHDGQAVTCEDFVLALEDASGVDLAQFRHWYAQAGTPVLDVEDSWDESSGCYEIVVRQHCPATPGQRDKLPFHLPMSVALLDQRGLLEGSEQILQLREREQQFSFEGLQQKPVPSLLRGFSAPVKLNFRYSDEDLLNLLRHETDGFTRWDASQRYMIQLLQAHVSGQCSISSEEGQQKVAALAAVLADELQLSAQGEWPSGSVGQSERDAAQVAYLISVPDYNFIAEQFALIDAVAIVDAVRALRRQLATALLPDLRKLYLALDRRLAGLGEYQPEAGQIALRSLKNVALSYFCEAVAAQESQQLIELMQQQFHQADNMSDQYAALLALLKSNASEAVADGALDEFHAEWRDEPLVVNQWLSAQVSIDKPQALDNLRRLQGHSAYEDSNPNKVRALIGAFCMRNFARFHTSSGEGYALLADEVLRLDALNPQLASRLLAPFALWRRFAEPQRGLMQRSLQRIAGADLSTDVFEVVSKTLAEPES